MAAYRQPFRGSYPITQKYGELIPGVTYKDRPHTGIDYACPIGTEILASADGVIKYAQYDQTGYGYTVIIRHNDGKATLYAHLEQPLVKVNMTVKQGNVIGLSGASGNATGPHLHFEARTNWADWRTAFDPMDLPLMTVDDSINTERPDLKGAECFQPGQRLKIAAPLGAKGFYNQTFSGYSTYNPGAEFYYTGTNVVRKDNGLTYMQLVPAMFTVWMAVHDNDCQILQKANQ